MKTSILALAATALVFSGCGEKAPEPQTTKAVNAAPIKVVIDIPRIALKSKGEVTAAMGNPSGCEETKYGEKCSFTPGETEIVFIDGKADWITVNDMAALPYSEDSLAALGLPVVSPAFRGQDSLRWGSIAGLREVTFFSSGESVWYAYIKAKTE